MSNPAPAPAERTVLGHPPQLFMLFFSELWERFSFYGMRALLTLYLTTQLFRSLGDPGAKETAFGIYAAYGALVYTTPFIGGILADKVLGFKRSTMLGAVLMAIGHFIMAIENEPMLYLALSFLIVGNGFFKPNISSMVGGLYKQGDPRRDGAFTIFYLGINVGAFLAPLACGYLGETHGWWLGFGLAGVGMVAGLLLFGWGQGSLGDNGEPSNLDVFKKWSVPVYVGAFLSVGVFALLVWQYEIMSYLLTPFAIGVIGYLVVNAFMRGGVERDRLLVVVILLCFTTVFWAFFEQAGSSLTLFTNSNVDREIFGMSVGASLFQSVNPGFIMLLAIPFSYMWTGLGKAGLEPNTPVKFALGIAQLGLGFLLLAASTGFVEVKDITLSEGGEMVTVTAAVVPVMFLIGGYFLHTTGELFLSPVGLSMVTKLAPKEIGAMVMGGWFLSSAVAHHAAGIIAAMTTGGGHGGEAAEATGPAGQIALDAGIIDSLSAHPPEVLASFDALATATDVFGSLGWVAMGCGALLLVISPLLKKMMHGVN
jgi:POT family proton-dependent oligopeptide transporter